MLLLSRSQYQNSRGPSLTTLFPARHLSGCHLPEGFQLSRSFCRTPWEPAMGSVDIDILRFGSRWNVEQAIATKHTRCKDDVRLQF